MILYPPERFDLNEWFILLTATTVILIVLLLPKRFPPALTAFILLFNVFLGQTVDFLIGVPPYDLYDVNDSPKYEITDFVLYFSSYPSVAYTMLHFYDKWEVKGSRVILYIGGWSFLTMGLEWAAELAHVFKYKEWRLWYSLLVYIGIYILNILALHLARYLLHK
ncbi:MAG TPA: CBO0543 family protein, partial [Bacilli bacterium]